jgi:hypothetical protein
MNKLSNIQNWNNKLRINMIIRERNKTHKMKLNGVIRKASNRVGITLSYCYEVQKI